MKSLVFAQNYPASCPKEAQSIVEAVGGCAEIDASAYAAVSAKCCILPPQRQLAVFWVVIAVVAIGLIVAVWYWKRRKLKA